MYVSCSQLLKTVFGGFSSLKAMDGDWGPNNQAGVGKNSPRLHNLTLIIGIREKGTEE